VVPDLAITKATPTGDLKTSQLATWGDNGLGACDVPLGNNYIAIAAGSDHGLALTPEPATLLLLGLGAVMLRRKLFK